MARPEAGGGARDWLRLSTPQSLVHTIEGVAFAIVCVLILILILFFDIASAEHRTIGSLSLLVILAAAWLLSLRVTVALTCFAMGLRLMAVVSSNLDPVTGLTQLLLIPASAAMARVAATRVMAVRQNAARAALVSRISRIATSADSLQAILEGVLGEMARSGLRGGVIALLNERNELYIAAADGQLDDAVRRSRLPAGQGIMGKSVSEDRSLLIDDLDAPGPIAPANRDLGSNAAIKSLVVVPLRAAGRVIGVLELDSADKGRFKQEDLSLLEQVAVAVSGAVQRAGALQLADEQLQRRLAELSLLLRAAQVLTATLDIERIYEAAARLASEIGHRMAPGARRGAVLRIDRDVATRVAVYDEQDFEESERPTFAVSSHQLLAEVLRTGTAMASDHLSLAADARQQAEQRQVVGGALAPIRTRAGIVGALAISTRQPAEFEESELRLLEGLAQLVGLAIANAESLHHEQSRVREVSSLLEAAQKLSASLDLTVIYNQVVESAARIVLQEGTTGRRRATLFQVRQDKVSAVAEYDELGASLGQAEFPLAAHPGMLRAIETGRAATARLGDLALDRNSAVRVRADKAQFRAGVYAPVRSGGNLFGVLGVASRVDRDFEESELRLVEGIANLAGLAISNAERLRLEMQRVEELRMYGQRTAALEHAKSEFLRLASHELRGPLAVIRGYVAMLEDGSMGEMPAAMRPIFPILSNKVSEMNMLIDQMLETARLEDSSLHLNLAPVDLGDALDDAIRTVRPFASNRHRLVVDRGNGELPVNADATRLNTILVNLIGNAIKYSPAGGEVRCRIVADDSRASVEISDQGLGINESDLPRLFTRFGRIVTPENSHIQGTGLGLYLARELARMHGGDITVESTPGAGSTFRLCLPLATSAKA